MRRALEDWEGGINVGGDWIKNLRFADDTILIAATEEEASMVLRRVEHESAYHGLTVNRQKTKVMFIDNSSTSTRAYKLENIEKVTNFIYLDR